MIAVNGRRAIPDQSSPAPAPIEPLLLMAKALSFLLAEPQVRLSKAKALRDLAVLFLHQAGTFEIPPSDFQTLAMVMLTCVKRVFGAGMRPCDEMLLDAAIGSARESFERSRGRGR